MASKSERRLVEEVQLNIAYRWFCGFELDDTIPNHSTFSKTRTRKWQQSDLFQKAFYEIVKQCIDSGLIDGEAMAADGSYIPANVSRESWINVETEVEQSMQSYLDSLDEELSNQPGFKKPPTKIVRKCRTTSQTDPNSGYINHGSKRGIGYLMEATVDCKHGILTGVDVYSANEKESLLVLRHLERQINLGIPMSWLALDRGYETGAVHRGLELLGIIGYIPAIQFSNPPEKYGFSYDPQLDAFICPKGVPLTYHRLNCSKSTGKYLRCYQVEGDACMRCPKRPSCFDKAGIRRRVLASSCYPAFFRGHQRVGTSEYLSMMRLRKIWAEGSFSVLKREHCISRIRKRGILAATEECLLAAMALNLKRMVNAIFRYPQIYCSAGITVGFSSFFAFVNRSAIVHYPSYCTLSYLSPHFYFRHNLYVTLKNTPCELLEFSPHGVLLYFSFSRISSAVIPDASSFFSTASASTFLAASAALASAFAFFASRAATSFSAFFRAAFFSFRSAFKVSMFAVMEVISEVREAMDSCFSAILDAKSLVILGRFLLPLVLGIVNQPFYWYMHSNVFAITTSPAITVQMKY